MPRQATHYSISLDGRQPYTCAVSSLLRTDIRVQRPLPYNAARISRKLFSRDDAHCRRAVPLLPNQLLDVDGEEGHQAEDEVVAKMDKNSNRGAGALA